MAQNVRRKDRNPKHNILVQNTDTGHNQTATPALMKQLKNNPRQWAKVRILGYANKAGELIEGTEQEANEKYGSRQPIVEGKMRTLEDLKRNVDMGEPFSEQNLLKSEKAARSEDID